MTMSPEPYTCDLDPLTNTTLKMYLFKNVQNVEAIRTNIQTRAWPCAAVRAGLVAAPLQVAVAANGAAVSRASGTMRTRTVYSEILYNLSLTKNISKSLSQFGIGEGRDLLVCFLITAEQDESRDILPQIDGDPRPLAELGELTRLGELRSVYKLDNVKDDVELLDIIVSRMATKHFVSH